MNKSAKISRYTFVPFAKAAETKQKKVGRSIQSPGAEFFSSNHFRPRWKRGESNEAARKLLAVGHSLPLSC
jgi:hypothetical protein